MESWKEFRVSVKALAGMNHEDREHIFNMLESMDPAEVLATLAQRSRKADEANQSRAQKAVKQHGVAGLGTVAERIENAKADLEKLFTAQAEHGFIITASVLADVWFNGQFAHGKKMEEAYAKQIDKANRATAKAHGLDLGNVRKANGALKGQAIMAGQSQGEYLKAIAGIE
jgi:hypothetical protein